MRKKGRVRNVRGCDFLQIIPSLPSGSVFFSFCFYSADYTVIHFLLDSFFNIAGDYYVCTTQNNWGQGIDGYFCIGGVLVKKKGGGL